MGTSQRKPNNKIKYGVELKFKGLITIKSGAVMQILFLKIMELYNVKYINYLECFQKYTATEQGIQILLKS